MLYSRPEAVLTAVLLAAGLLPMNANAYVSFSKNGEELINTLHTHIYSPTLSLPSSKEIKVAKVCFITDVSDCSGNEFANSDDMENNGSPDDGGNPDYDLDDAERCRNEGYTISGCPDGFKPSGKCPYGDYYAKCVETCPSGYKTCEPPYYGVGEACDGKYASCEEDTERACKELNPDYINTCESGWQINPNDKCKYDETFGTCCNQCIGYDYTTIPEGYVQDGEVCTDCNGQNKYKIKPNPCDGFLDCGSMGGEAGAETCLSGTVTKYDNCKPCPNLGTLTSCPSPYTCTYEECSNRYYKSGCQSGYDWNASSQTCTAQCDSSYKYTCTGANESPSGTACNGKYQSCACAYGYVWNDGSCKEDTTCKIGSILYSDKTCSITLKANKTAIGVVAYVNGSGGQALALNSIGNYKWGVWTNIPTLPEFDGIGAIRDYDSCGNTEKIMDYGDASWYPATWAAHEYSTPGTSVGDWCLPSAGILFSYLYNKDIVNIGYLNAKGTPLIDTYVWSSSKWVGNNNSGVFAGNFTGKGELIGFSIISSSFEVRPVIEFQQ